MDNNTTIAIPQANQLAEQETKMTEMKKKQKRFQMFGIGSFLYALFYTFCLYRNASGITYPFFVGGTLLFFGYFTRKSGSSSADGKEQTKAHINRMFLGVCIVMAGILNCATDSGVLIFFNKVLMLVLFGVLLLQYWHDLTGWSVTAYVKGGAAMLFGGIANMIAPVYDMSACLRLRHMDSGEEGLAEKSAGRRRLVRSVGIGLLIVIPMAMFIAILLASADAVFCSLLYDILTFSVDIDGVENVIKIAVMLVAVFAVCYGIFAYNVEPQNKKTIDDMAGTERTGWDSYIAVTVNGVMGVMYVFFSGIQIISLFLGKIGRAHV